MDNYHNITITTTQKVKEASQAEQVKLYFKLKLKFGVAERNIFFNRQCLKLNLVPKYVTITSNNNSTIARKSVEIAQRSWIKKEISRWYKTRDSLSFYIFVLHCQLTKKLHKAEWDFLDNKCRDQLYRKLSEKTVTQNRKLQRLIEGQQPNPINNIDHHHQFADRVKNFSSITFSSRETDLLGHGTKYNKSSNLGSKELEGLACSIDSNWRVSQNRILTNKCADIILQEKTRGITPKSKHTEDVVVQKIKKKVKTNDLMILKADKGCTTVIMDRIEYLGKVNNFLTDNNFVEINSDPTTKINKLVKSKLADTTRLFDKKETKYLTVMNPYPPRLFGQPKLHKANIPIRPVVSFVNSPCSKLAHKLNSCFRSLTGFQPKYGIKNALELVNKIKHIPVPSSHKIVSFDVTNLFTNIPVEESLNRADEIMRATIDDNIVRTELLGMMKLCSEYNYFKFNDKFFEQKDGLAMGSPLSPLLAELFMDNLESRIFENSPFKDKIVYWFRYVDDIICLWKGSNRQLDHFLKYLNSLHNKIKFTIEVEQDNVLNFLDLRIDHSTGSHDFSIFRKPTHTDVIIPHHSCHPISHKLAAFNSMIYRALTVPMSHHNFDKEIRTIKQIAVTNGYEEIMVDRILNRISRRLAIDSSTAKIMSEERSWITVPYLGLVSDKLGQELKKNGFDVAFRTTPILKSLFSCSKDKINIWDKSGVYKLNCADCNACYVGQTGRSFKCRIREHIRDWNKQNGNSNFAEHLITNNHKFKAEENVEFLHVHDKSRQLNILEALEITRVVKTDPSLSLNDQIYFSQYNTTNLVLS